MQANILLRTKFLWSNLLNPVSQSVRGYAKKSDDGCRKAVVDLPPEVDPDCPQPCVRRKTRKEGILHRIKMRVIEGGTNFGTPFRRLQCKPQVCVKKEEKLKALPPPEKKKLPPMSAARAGVQVSVLGADTAVGQFVALLLKQCSCIKKIRLYEAASTQPSTCTKTLSNVVQDLQHINTNCQVQAFSCVCNELDHCLQTSDIVLMLESSYISVEMPADRRFCYQAPIVKKYADVIATECPKAFIIVCATPIDCMVPLVAETLKETGWYDPRKLLGSVSVAEMRASTLAARALCLEPRYTRVPCVGGTEGDGLVPLFSRAVEYFDFAKHNAELMTEAIRNAPLAVSKSEGIYSKAAYLSEAHALAGLVCKVANALLCKDIPRVSGFVEADPKQVISPARFITLETLLNNDGICKQLELPIMNNHEEYLMNVALPHVAYHVDLARCWHAGALHKDMKDCKMAMQKNFMLPREYEHVQNCKHQLFT